MSKPTKINFECSTYCNAHCTFCPLSDMTRPKGQMTDELFHKIIKEGKEMGVRQFSPFFMGEPFIFPRIWEWLDYMEKEGVSVALYTNGEFIDVDKIVKYKNIRYLDFSINASMPETHAKVMRGPNFEVVKRNFEKARKKAPFMVRASFVTIEENAHEVEEFKKMFGRTEVVGFTNWTGDMHDALERKGKRVPCWVLFHQMMVLWDGRVVPCCADYSGKQILGDANTQTLKEIWDSAEWMRDKHRKLEFDIPVCKDCNSNTMEEK